MTIQRMLELLEIEHECILRNSHNACDRNCADCDLVQDDDELHEMYTDVIALLKEHEAMEQCLKTKCVICLHCDNCDVDENGLLKEQEIKSMTLEELDEIYEKQDTHIWPFDTPPYLWMTVNPDVRLTDGFWICWRDVMYSIKNDSPFYVRENYGKAWLIWTGKPTQEQVQAVKWDEDQ